MALGSVQAKRTSREGSAWGHCRVSGPGNSLCTAWTWLAGRSSLHRFCVASNQAEGTGENSKDKSSRAVVN